MERRCSILKILFMSRVTVFDIGHLEVEVIIDSEGRDGASPPGVGTSSTGLLDSSYVQDLLLCSGGWETGKKWEYKVGIPLKNSLGTSDTGEKSVPGSLNDAPCQRLAQLESARGGARRQAGPREGMHLESSERLIWSLVVVGVLGQGGA